jgi:hypothetical protein
MAFAASRVPWPILRPASLRSAHDALASAQAMASNANVRPNLPACGTERVLRIIASTSEHGAETVASRVTFARKEIAGIAARNNTGPQERCRTANAILENHQRARMRT